MRGRANRPTGLSDPAATPLPPPPPRQAAADAASDFDEVLRLRGDVLAQAGGLPQQAANLAKYYRILT